MRLLILSCSATKRDDAGLLPAARRYDGPAFRLLRKALRELAQAAHPQVAILSAKFGLIAGDTPISWYDRQMDAARALALAPIVQLALPRFLSADTSEVFVNLGRHYESALGTVPTGPWCVTYAQGGIGERLGQLRRWLYAGESLEVPDA